MIDRATISKIMDAANIVDVVSDFVTLKRAGANLKGLCPFHDDRTPSFMVSPAKNYCKCFACGKGGNPVGFIMEHEQISYPEALRYLAKKYGITIEEKELTQEDIQRQDDRESMFIVNQWACEWFQHQLNDTPDGRAIGLSYFRERGFRDDIIQKFQLGFCPDKSVEQEQIDAEGHKQHVRMGLMSHDALKAGYQEKYLTNNPETGIGTGLSIKNDKGALRDRYWGRVIFPIFTMSGKIVGFGGRVLAAATKGVNVKYQNSPESVIYSKKRELYGLFQAKMAIRKHDLCYLVEGYTDVMAMHQSGMENVVASSGTALTDDQIRLIHRLTDNITVVYDGDAAGIKASQRGIDMLLAQGMNVRLLLLPDGDDPDSFARKHNAEEYQQYMADHQVDFIKFKTNLLLEEAKGDPVAKSQLVNNIVQSLSVIPNEITRAIYIQETARTMQIQENLIASAVAKARGEERKANGERRMANGEGQSPRNEETISEIENKTESPTQEDNTPLLQSISTRDDKILRDKEAELIKLVLRKGEQVIGNIQEEQGTQRAVTVAEYIGASLRQDELTLSTPLFRRILDLTLENIREPGFMVERFFLNHPDAEINSLTFELVSDNQQLSRMHQRKGPATTAETDSLSELANHLLRDYKLEILAREKRQVMKQLQDPMLVHQALNRLKEIKETEKLLRG